MAQHEELMKKTETMNVVMETNKILREEKERLEQDLQQMQAKVCNLLIKSKGMLFLITYEFLHQVFKKKYWFCFQVRKLELDILPLQEANAELSEKSGMLQAEKKLLEEDVKRWKARNQVNAVKPILKPGNMLVLNNRVKIKEIKYLKN